VLLAEKRRVLQGITHKLIEIGKFCGMGMNVEKTKVKESQETISNTDDR